MLFARYKGSSDDFVDGKVYLAKPEVNGAETVGFGFIEVVNEDGHRLRVNPEGDSFEYLGEVYAVVTKPFEELEAGEVIVLDGATDDGALLNVKGIGYRQASNLIILDRSNVFPGVVVMDLSTGKWLPVSRVDECLWLTVLGSRGNMSPCEFRFAVADGDILTEPIVKCTDSAGEPGLTSGNNYILTRTLPDDLLVIRNDDGEEKSYFAGRFHKDF